MTSGENARILSVQLCVSSRGAMEVVETANVLEGVGIEGDRHATSDVARKGRQILLMDQETLESFGLSTGEIRENVTTSGIDLATLPAGQKLGLGEEVVLRITGDCAPCAFIDGIRPGLRREMEGRRGILAYASKGGTIKVGDAVRVLEGAEVV